MSTPSELRLDVLAAWRAVANDDDLSAARILATCDDPGHAWLFALELCSLITRAWLPGDELAVHALIDRLVAEEMAETDGSGR